MYKYRESIPLGMTALDQQKVRSILVGMSKEWPGNSYDLLAKNCNHFCDELSRRLGVGPIPGWLLTTVSENHQQRLCRLLVVPSRL